MTSSLVRRELRGKYAKSVLGFLWSFLSPMFQILVYTFAFSVIFHNDLPNYYIFLMAGTFPWTFFADSFNQGAMSIAGNAEMVKKIYFPREVLVVAEVKAKLINMLLSFMVMAVFLMFSGVGFSRYLLLLPVAVLGEFMIALGLSLLVAAVTVYLQDMEYIVTVITMAWIWVTPVMYNIRGIDEGLRRLLYINPMTPVVLAYQDILYWHEMPQFWSLVLPLAEGAVFLLIGEAVFIRMSRRFAEEL